MGLREALSFSSWYIAANTEDVIFDLKEPKELLKKCRNRHLKEFFRNLHYRFLGYLMYSGCMVGALFVAGVVYAVIMLIISLFWPDFNPGDDSKGKDESNVTLWTPVWFFCGLVVIFTFFGLLNELLSVFFTRFSASTASFRNQGLLVYGGISHAEWEEITGVTLYCGKEEPDYVVFEVNTSKKKTPKLEFVLTQEAIESAVRFRGEDVEQAGCFHQEPIEKLDRMEIHIDDVAALLELDVPEVKTVYRLDGDQKVKCGNIVAYGACDTAVVFFESREGIIQRAWCRLRLSGKPEENYATQVLDLLSDKWDLLIVDWKACKVCKLSKGKAFDKYIKVLKKQVSR